MGIKRTNEKHEAIYQEVLAVLKKHGDALTAREQLAIMSNIVGKLIAMQDQRTRSPSLVMEEVARNIELGNQLMIASLQNTKGSA